MEDKKSMHIYIYPEEQRKIKAAAAIRGLTIRQFILMAVENMLDTDVNEEKKNHG